MKPGFTILALLLCIACISQEPVDSRKQEIVFTSVNVIPMDKEQVLENQDVVIKDGKITAIGTTKKVKYGKQALLIDAKGKYLMPGLAEMHAHVPPIDDIEPMKDVALLFALKGVTTIRGMLGHPLHLELRDQLKNGSVIGPRFHTSGPSFNGQSVSSPEVAARMVREQKQAGYDFLKLHPGITKEHFAALATTAKEVNIPFAGHVSFDVGVWRAIDAGYATIDHLDGFVESLVPGIESISEQEVGIFGMFIADKADTTRIPKLMQELKQKNIWVVPTQALAERWFSPGRSPEELGNAPEMKYMDQQTRNNWVQAKKNLMKNQKYNADAVNRYIDLRRKLIFECNKTGVGLLLGSDAPQIFDVPGFSVHHELQYLVDAGLTPYEALRSGTVNVGKFYNQADLGVIKKGALSDLILLSANPLTDISNTKQIEGVMLGDKWLSKEYIDAQLKRLEKN